MTHDPRSGEIISSEVKAFANVQTFGASWYLVQAGPADKRAQQLPLPDDITGEMIRAMVAHQIGHTLGLEHNLKASSLYTVAQVRDPKWVKENGYVPSIMDDAAFNYVAQPEDGIDPADLMPKIGPYDKFAIVLGYKPVAGARTPDAEKPTLDQWAREQDTKPYLRFAAGANSADPGESPETPDTAAVQLPGPVGDGDAVAAATLALKNLGRVSAMLFKATTHEGRRSVGRPRGSLRPHGVAVVGRDGPGRPGDRRRGFEAAAHRPGRRPVHDGAQGAADGRARVPDGERVPHADVHAPARRPASHPAVGRRRPASARRR